MEEQRTLVIIICTLKRGTSISLSSLHRSTAIKNEMTQDISKHSRFTFPLALGNIYDIIICQLLGRKEKNTVQRLFALCRDVMRKEQTPSPPEKKELSQQGQHGRFETSAVLRISTEAFNT